LKVLKAIVEFDPNTDLKKKFSSTLSSGALPHDVLSKTLCKSRYDVNDTRQGAHNMWNQTARLEAMLTQRDRKGFTCLEHAQKMRNRDMVSYLHNAPRFWKLQRSLKEAREDKDMLGHLVKSRASKNKKTNVLKLLETKDSKCSMFVGNADQNGRYAIKTLAQPDLNELAFTLGDCGNESEANAWTAGGSLGIT